MRRVVLVYWNHAEGKERAAKLAQAGFKVKLEHDPRQGPAILRRLREAPPDAVVIDLGRLPMQGRDAALALRNAKQMRHVTLVFVDGEPPKVEKIRQTLPDAVFTSWANTVPALKAAKPSLNPIVPASNLAGYSGTPLPKKLGIKPNFSIVLLNEPENFVEILGDVPAGVEFTNRITPAAKLAIWFVRSAAELSSRIDAVAAALGIAHLWICWAKRTSPLAADVTEPTVRTAGLAAGLVDYKVAAIDADWSGLLFAPRRDDGAGAGNSRRPRK
jgi:hypothetical protein